MQEGIKFVTYPGCCGNQSCSGGVVRRQRGDADVLVVHASHQKCSAVILLPYSHVKAVQPVRVDCMHPLIWPCMSHHQLRPLNGESFGLGQFRLILGFRVLGLHVIDSTYKLQQRDD